MEYPPERLLRRFRPHRSIFLRDYEEFAANVKGDLSQAHPQFCGKPWARRGGRFLRTPRRWFLFRQGGFSRGFSAALRYRLPLRKDTGWTRENLFPPGFFIHRSPPRAILAGGKLGVGKRFFPASLSLLIAARVQEGKAPGFRVPALIIKRPRGLRVHGEEGVREGSFTQGSGRKEPDGFVPPLYCRCGCSMVTMVSGGTSRVIQTLPPMTERAPMTVEPRIVAFE